MKYAIKWRDSKAIEEAYVEHLPECSQNRTSCKFNKERRCTILTDTYFKRWCPFYKVREN